MVQRQLVHNPVVGAGTHRAVAPMTSAALRLRADVLLCCPACLAAEINTAFDLLHSGKCLRCVLTFDK